ncbi:hypothetical protein FS749_008080, partial [Ceratobasidium sp. UAMH 11750]
MSRPSITSNTPIPEIVSLLSQSGCPDISAKLNLEQCSQWSIDGGGQGDIYKGMLLNGEHVAIKTSRGDQSLDLSKGNVVFKRVARELHTWYKLDHQNTAKLLGMAVFRGHIAMISPWVEPGNFYKFIAAFPDADRMDLCLQVANGLAYLHENGVVFGDLKAQNVLVGRDGVAKLTDFGLSVLEQPKISFSSTQNPGGGSTRWMAPELITDSTGRSFEADVYALGMTFIEILTDEYPFPELSDVNIMFAVATKGIIPARPERLTVQSPRHEIWWELLQKCWNREPSMRPKASDWHTLDRGSGVPVEPASLQAEDRPSSAELLPETLHRPDNAHNIEIPAASETSEGSPGDLNGLRDGIYYIHNVRHGNKAIVPLDATHEDLVGSDKLKGGKWVIERQLNASGYSIKSAEYDRD